MIFSKLINLIGRGRLYYIKSLIRPFESKNMLDKRRDFFQQILTKGDLVFDIGANYGNRISPILDLGVRVLAVDPQKDCIDFLKLKFGDKIYTENCGLGEKAEYKDFFISKKQGVLSSFSEDFIEKTTQSGRFKKGDWSNKVKTKIDTFDNLISKYGKPQFAKIDVEGFEINVLKGLSVPIPIISLEYCVPEMLDSLKLCIQRYSEIADKKLLYNYSIGESMHFEFNDWLSESQFLDFICSDEFLATEFGDVYIKYNA